MSFDNRIGTEDFQYRLFAVLYKNLNAQIALQQSVGQALDTKFNTLTGSTVAPAVLETLDPMSFHYGHRPSLIDAPVLDYPAVAVFGSRSTSRGRQDNNYGSTTQLLLNIEAFAKSDGYSEQADDPFRTAHVGEEQVGRRVQRFAEAIHATIIQYAATEAFDVAPPSVTFGDIFARPESITGTGDLYFFQSVHLQYAFAKDNVQITAPDIDQF